MQALNRGQRVRKHGGDENNGGSGPATPSATACVSMPGTPASAAAAAGGHAASAPSTPGAFSAAAAPTASSTAEQGGGTPQGGGVHPGGNPPPRQTPTPGSCSDGTTQSSSSSSSVGSSSQPRKRPKTLLQQSAAANDTESAGGETEETDAEDAALNSEIELVFKPQPQMMLEDSSAQVRYIKTTANATVDHLSKYLAMRLALDKFEQDASAPRSVAPFAIFIAATPGQFTPLPGSMTLDQVNDKYWKLNKPLEMYYAHHRSSGGGGGRGSSSC